MTVRARWSASASAAAAPIAVAVVLLTIGACSDRSGPAATGGPGARDDALSRPTGTGSDVSAPRPPASSSSADGKRSGSSAGSSGAAGRAQSAGTGSRPAASAQPPASRCTGAADASKQAGQSSYPEFHSLADSPHDEALAWDGLSTWWSCRPLFRAPAPLGTIEHDYAWSIAGGSRGDPATAPSAALVVYDTRRAPVETNDLIGVVRGGGYAIGHHRLTNPPSMTPPATATSVDFGPGPGKQWTMDLGDGSVIRFTRWEFAGQALVVYTSTAYATDADVRAFVGSMRQV
ncbi:MAG: hypothetical protein QOI20_2611 [Acidimicrobiaceae bacterium]|nr:hypothetical protein [Acidimicrobiaceae bacterium]